MTGDRWLAALAGLLFGGPAAAQGSPGQYPSGRLSGEYQWTEGEKKSSDSSTFEEGSCVAFLTFLPDGGMKFSYLYGRVSSQTWDYSHRPPNSTPFRKTERRTTDQSGQLVKATTGPPNPRMVEGPYVDSIRGNLRLKDYPDGSLDLVYPYAHWIPVLSKTEVINTDWGGQVTTETPVDWHKSRARCEPYVYVWLQQGGLRKSQGSLDRLAGSAGLQQAAGKNRWIAINWEIKRP